VPNVIGSQAHEVSIIQNSPQSALRILLGVTEDIEMFSLHAIVDPHMSLLYAGWWPQGTRIPRGRLNARQIETGWFLREVAVSRLLDGRRQISCHRS
jgi:hypothetical protein